MDPATLAALMQALQTFRTSAAGIGQGLGLFGDTSQPYQAAEKEINDFYNRSKSSQNPFYNMGTGAIPQFQDFLKKMSNPTDFINNTMNQYQESPWAKFQQQQALRAATNMGSSSGLSGSTPLMQFAEQNARDISSQDINQWLQNVLGINTKYGEGLQSEITGGQNSANTLTNLNTDFGKMIAELQYNKNAAENQQRSNLWGGIFSLI